MRAVQREWLSGSFKAPNNANDCTFSDTILPALPLPASSLSHSNAHILCPEQEVPFLPSQRLRPWVWNVLPTPTSSSFPQPHFSSPGSRQCPVLIKPLQIPQLHFTTSSPFCYRTWTLGLHGMCYSPLLHRLLHPPWHPGPFREPLCSQGGAR